MAKKPARKITKSKAAPPKRFKARPEGISDRQHLTGIIQAGTGCTAKAAKETMDALIGTITSSLKKNQKVQLFGFGTFNVTRRAAHRGRNPRTGDAIRVKASKAVRFKAGQTLKRSV
jgi:DNA-binding protein HU-beta